MDSEINLPGAYRVEVSGWGLDESFFVEQTDLHWSQHGEKKIWLHHELSEGAMVFVRLLVPESTSTSVPVTYQVSSVDPMGCNGLCEMRLTQLHPRSKESITRQVASKLHEESQRTCEPTECPKKRDLEEILQ